MKRTLFTKTLLLSLLVSALLSFTACKSDVVDMRDGKKYKTVKIGSQTWMAENLNYETQDSYCYENDESNCSKYGRLYTWTAAKKACPSGWHLPSKAEFETLFSSVGGIKIAGKSLKSKNGWNEGGHGMDAFGFSALPAGHRINYGFFLYEATGAFFWSSTEDDSKFAFRMDLFYSLDSAHMSAFDKGYGFSVRCLKD